MFGLDKIVHSQLAKKFSDIVIYVTLGAFAGPYLYAILIGDEISGVLGKMENLLRVLAIIALLTFVLIVKSKGNGFHQQKPHQQGGNDHRRG